MEKVIYSRLEKFLDKYNILSKLQFGFRTAHSTQDAIIKYSKDILNDINNK